MIKQKQHILNILHNNKAKANFNFLQVLHTWNSPSPSPNKQRAFNGLSRFQLEAGSVRKKLF